MKRWTSMVPLVFALFSAGVPAGMAEEAGMILSKEAVIQASLEHSFRLKASGQTLESAETRIRQAVAQSRPLVDVSLHAQHYEGLESSALAPGVSFNPVEDQYGVSAGLSQPLYTAGKLKNQAKSAKLQKQAAENDLKSTEASVTLETISTYWIWSKAFYALDALKTAVSRMEVHSKDMQNLRQAGLATDNETLATDVLLDKTRLHLQEAERRVALSKARIAYLTGTEPSPEAQPERAPDARDLVVGEETDLLAQAAAARPEIASLQKDMESAQAQVKVFSADHFPHAFFAVGCEAGQPNSMFFPPKEHWDEYGYVGLKIQWIALDSGLTQARVDEAKSNVLLSRIQSEELLDRIRMEVRDSRIRLQDALARLPVATRVVESAQRNLDSATTLWQNGLARHSEVLDAHSDLTDSLFALEDARADVWLAQAQLDYALGSLAPADGEE